MPKINTSELYDTVHELSNAPKPETQALLAQATAQPAPPVLPQPAPPIDQGGNVVPQPSDGTAAPTAAPSEQDAVSQLQALASQPAQELKVADQAPPSIENQDQGLTGQLANPGVAPPVKPSAVAPPISGTTGFAC